MSVLLRAWHNGMFLPKIKMSPFEYSCLLHIRYDEKNHRGITSFTSQFILNLRIKDGKFAKKLTVHNTNVNFIQNNALIVLPEQPKSSILLALCNSIRINNHLTV